LISESAIDEGAVEILANVLIYVSRGIIENAAGKRSLRESIKSSLQLLLLRPHNFFFSKPFGLIFVSFHPSGVHFELRLY
jgi:hypothetical protein